MSRWIHTENSCHYKGIKSVFLKLFLKWKIDGVFCKVCKKLIIITSCSFRTDKFYCFLLYLGLYKPDMLSPTSEKKYNPLPKRVTVSRRKKSNSVSKAPNLKVDTVPAISFVADIFPFFSLKSCSKLSSNGSFGFC